MNHSSEISLALPIPGIWSVWRSHFDNLCAYEYLPPHGRPNPAFGEPADLILQFKMEATDDADRVCFVVGHAITCQSWEIANLLSHARPI